jgi:hypothetical protein
MFITNDQKAAIGGESTFQFITTIGCGIEKVDVTMSYEYDYEGIFNTCIESVTFQGVDISGCIDAYTILDLEMQGLNAFETEKRKSWEE